MPVHLTSTGKLLAGELRMEPDPVSRIGRHAPGRLTVFSAGTREKLGEVEVGRGPLTISSSPDGRIGYVSCVVSSTVDIVDLETLQSPARLDIAKLGEPAPMVSLTSRTRTDPSGPERRAVSGPRGAGAGAVHRAPLAHTGLRSRRPDGAMPSSGATARPVVRAH